MAGALAHELNQPLTAFINSVNAGRRMIARGALDRADTIRDVLDEAADQALRAGEIVRRLREFVTRGDIEMHIESLPTLIREASDLASVGTAGLGVNTRLSFDPRAETALVNKIQLQQVMLNLMRNAREAMGSSERRDLDVATARLDDGSVEIVVADSGTGLSDEIVEHLFEPFHTTSMMAWGWDFRSVDRSSRPMAESCDTNPMTAAARSSEFRCPPRRNSELNDACRAGDLRG